MLKCTLTTLFALVTGLTSAQALNCYNCWAWDGTTGHVEACRANGQNSRTCTATNTFVLDPVTKTITNKTVADLNLDDPTRKRGDPLCFKQGGTDTNGRAVAIRGCAEAPNDSDFNGYCEVSRESETWPGLGTIRAGFVMWLSTANNGNGGSVTGTCSANTLSCYNCWAWEGTQGHMESCRANGQNSIPCTATNTMVIDPVTKKITNQTVADLELRDPTRKRGDPLCFKQGGTDTNDKAVVLRGCAVAPDDSDFNGVCEVSKDSETWPGLGTFKAGFIMWLSTATNGNGGPATGKCSGAGLSVAASGVMVLLAAIASVAFKH